jgi:hypothetical protein
MTCAATMQTASNEADAITLDVLRAKAARLGLTPACARTSSGISIAA